MSQPPLPIVTAEQAATTPVQLSGALNTATWTERGLYGGAIVACLPNRFEDCRSVPRDAEISQCDALTPRVTCSCITHTSPHPDHVSSLILLPPASNFRVIPDHQEVWADADTDQSIIIELNSYDETVADADIAASETMMSEHAYGDILS